MRTFSIPSRIAPYEAEFNKLSKNAQYIVLKYGDNIYHAENELKSQKNNLNQIKNNLPQISEFNKINEPIDEVINFYELIRTLYLTASSSPPRPSRVITQPVSAQNNVSLPQPVSAQNNVSLPPKIVPHTERFYKLSKRAQEMILHYGDKVEEGFKTACELELQLMDRQSALFLEDYKMYGEVSDFYWKTKLVTTTYN